jgi:hypothetical protein
LITSGRLDREWEQVGLDERRDMRREHGDHIPKFKNQKILRAVTRH